MVGKTSFRYLISAGFILCGGGGGGGAGALLLVGCGGGGTCFSGSDLRSGADLLYERLGTSIGGLASYET